MEHIPLRMGDEGPAVRHAQQMLEAAGYPPGKLDGNFGARTLRAIVTFQSDKELPIDGIVAANTWTVLEKTWAQIRRETGGDLPGEKTKPPFQTVPPIPWEAEPVHPGPPEGRAEEPRPRIEAAEAMERPMPWRKIER